MEPISVKRFEGLPEDIRRKRIEGNEHGYEIVLAALKRLIESTP